MMGCAVPPSDMGEKTAELPVSSMQKSRIWRSHCHSPAPNAVHQVGMEQSCSCLACEGIRPWSG